MISKRTQMKNNYITSRGFLEINNHVIFIKNRKYVFYETGFARIVWALLPPACLILVLFFIKDPFKFYVRTVIFGIWTVERIPSIYRLLIKTSFSKRIPVENIVSAETTDDKNELETHVLLHLKNKRTRT